MLQASSPNVSSAAHRARREAWLVIVLIYSYLADCICELARQIHSALPAWCTMYTSCSESKPRIGLKVKKSGSKAPFRPLGEVFHER